MHCTADQSIVGRKKMLVNSDRFFFLSLFFGILPCVHNSLKLGWFISIGLMPCVCHTYREKKRDFSSCIKHLFAHTKIVIRKKRAATTTTFTAEGDFLFITLPLLILVVEVCCLWRSYALNFIGFSVYMKYMRVSIDISTAIQHLSTVLKCNCS